MGRNMVTRNEYEEILICLFENGVIDDVNLNEKQAKLFIDAFYQWKIETEQCKLLQSEIGTLKVILNQRQEPIVSGRVLYEFLEIKTPYTQWFNRMCKYGFVEDIDYTLVSQKCETNNSKNPFTEITDHILKIDMAKEISMLQRNEKGKQARHYFIEIEKQFNSPEIIMARALKMADNKINNLQNENIELKRTVKAIINQLENLL